LLGEWIGTNLIGYGKESKSFIAETTDIEETRAGQGEWTCRCLEPPIQNDSGCTQAQRTDDPSGSS
jgi:hypothetical protein